MAGLDQTEMPFPKGSPVAALANGRSRLDTTIQMRSFLEQSRLDGAQEASFASEYNGTSEYQCGGDFSRGSSSGRLCDVTGRSTLQSHHHGMASYSSDVVSNGKSRGSKFDELYRRALQEADESQFGGQQKTGINRTNGTNEAPINGAEPPRGKVTHIADAMAVVAENSGVHTQNDSQSERSYRSEEHSARARRSEQPGSKSRDPIGHRGSPSERSRPSSDSDASSALTHPSNVSRQSSPHRLQLHSPRSHESLPKSQTSQRSHSTRSQPKSHELNGIQPAPAATAEKLHSVEAGSDYTDKSVEENLEIVDFEAKDDASF